MMEPRDYAVRVERGRPAGRGDGDRFTGYGLMGLHFASGDILAFRRFAASSLGPPYTAVWHRDRAGRWVFHTDVDPGRSCPRYFGPALHDAHCDDMEIRWTGVRELVVSARRARLQLTLRLAATPATVALSTAARLVPRRLWLLPAVGRGVGITAAALLGTGAMPLSGTAPSGHRFLVRPRAIWKVNAAAGMLDGRDLGSVERLRERVALGDFVLPADGLLACGTMEFHGLVAGAVNGTAADVVTPRRRRAELLAHFERRHAVIGEG